MIPDKIKDLFLFIDFLHSNIDEFKKYDKLLTELRFLKDERIDITPVKNYKQKIKFDEIQSKISNKIATIKLSIIEPIVDKINTLNLCEFENEKTFWEWNVREVEEFHYNFNIEDLPEITKQKNKYVTFRTEINVEIYLLLRNFFTELDKLLKYLFDFFTESNSKEFDFMKSNITNDELFSQADKLIIDVIDLIGSEKYNAPKDINKAREVYKEIQDVTFFEIYFETAKGIEYNYNSILTPENWEQRKDTFFKQRMETYPESYTKDEKIKLELEDLEKLTINKNDYKILKERYKQHLVNETEDPEQEPPPKESEFIFVNNFDDVDEVDVYNHFKKLVEKKMLTDKQLNKYLVNAFQENKPPKKLIKLKNEITKKRLRNIFYTYFRDVAQRPHGKKDVYVKLLSNYFEGYPFTTTKSNFNK